MLATEGGRLNMKDVKLSDAKVIMIKKDVPGTIFVKHSFLDDFKQINVIKKPNPVSDIRLIPSYNRKIALAANKKADLMSLCDKNLIPNKHKAFFEAL